MGEARRKMLNGHVPIIRESAGVEVLPTGTIRVVSNLRLQNVDKDGVTVLMLGTDRPEIAVMLTPEQSRELIRALEAHVENLEHPILLPGAESPAAPPPLLEE